jgi:MFS family permease
MSVSSASARTFRSLQRHYNYRLYFGGQTISVAGTWVQNVAQAWLVLELTHSSATSALALGALALFQFLPYTLLGLLGGPVVDRFDKRATIVGTQTTLMVSAVILAALAFAHAATLWEVFGLAALGGAVQVIDTPARQAFVYEMVGRSELPNAVSLNASLFNLARAAGPAVGGVLIATVGVAVCFTLNAVSFLAVIAGLLLMRTNQLYTTKRDPERRLLRSLGEGFAWTLRTPTAWLVFALLLVVATFGINFNVLLPILASLTLHAGPIGFGILTACFGAGALIGALVTAAVGRPSWRLLLGGGAAFSALLMILAPLGSVIACGIALGLAGMAFTTYTSMSNATIQMAAPDRLRGRAMALYGYIFIGIPAPIGGLLAGWLSATGGTFLAFLVGGGVSLLAVAAAAVLYRRAIPARRSEATGPARPGGSLPSPAGDGLQGKAMSPAASVEPAPAMAVSSSAAQSNQ